MPLLDPAITNEAFIDHQNVARYELHHWEDSFDNNWNLGEYFGCIYVINLPQASTRREKVVKDLEAIGSPVFQFFEATDGHNDLSPTIWKKMVSNWAKIDTSTPEGKRALENQFKGEAGCFMSHYRVLKEVNDKFKEAKKALDEALNPDEIEQAKKRVRHYSSVLILEDDNGFGIVQEGRKKATLKNCGKIFRQAMSELPKEWDMLYFMAFDREYNRKISSHLVKLSRAVITNAYAINHTLYEAILKELQQIVDPLVTKILPVDNTLARLHKHCNAYAISPSIAFQRSGKSSITSKTAESLRQLQAYHPKH